MRRIALTANCSTCDSCLCCCMVSHTCAELSDAMARFVC